jgi:hypothetical protein
VEADEQRQEVWCCQVTQVMRSQPKERANQEAIQEMMG